jgi:indolepyruvate ferredoxin oxidoreductase beta subunit
MPEGLAPDLQVRAISIAILAMGGEGGGVLADWLVAMAEANGYWAQSTSVPGVAQRTGATIYYVEIFPHGTSGREPVLAMMPVPGEVDVVIASELMEAARAVQRGLVTPDRTTMIASSHRVYSMTERTAMGDGRLDSEPMLQSCEAAAKRLVIADMRALAESQGSVLSASLFGGLAGSDVLPFTRGQFEAAIKSGGVGVKSSLAAFAAGYDAARSTPAPTPIAITPEAAEIIAEGERRLRDYQDEAYAQSYRSMLQPLEGSGELLAETARYLALWMSFEDPIRVAQLKIRAARFQRVAEEVKLAPGQILRIREFMHPRLQEVAETLPGGLGSLILSQPLLKRLIGVFTQKGRIIETTSISGFMMLWSVAALRRWRRTTLRFQAEHAAINHWLARIIALAPTHPALALEVAQLQRLVKGYSDTHVRGRTNFDRLMALTVALESRADGPALLAKLRDAALADENGRTLATLLTQEKLG